MTRRVPANRGDARISLSVSNSLSGRDWGLDRFVPTGNFIGFLGHAVIGRETPDRADCEFRLAAFDAQGRISPHARHEAMSEWRDVEPPCIGSLDSSVH
jgi:hypothetical protein